MRKSAIGSVIIGVVLAAAAVQAEEANGFKTTLSLGGTKTDGNSKTLQGNGTLVTEGNKEGLGSVRAGAEANYGENEVAGEKNTTVNNSRGFADAKKTIGPRTFWYLAGSVVHDEIAEINYRATVGPGLGVYLVKNANTTLSTVAR
jgi:hypothetical protein